MLQTFEAMLQPDGHVRFSETEPPHNARDRRVLVTLLPEAASSVSELRAGVSTAPDWHEFVGTLANSANFTQHPLLIQQKLRSEWS
jgi:hypothetical protein